MRANGSRRGEFDLIADLFAPLAGGDPTARRLLDDAAVLPQRAGVETVLTTDTMVDGVHFLDHEPAGVVGARLLRVNLSDLAAMAAEPVGCLLDLSVPESTGDDWLEAFAEGLGRDLRGYGIPLLGGDTTTTPGNLTLSLTAIGEAPEGSSIPRSGARPGDVLLVSGTIGDASLGLRVLRGEDGLPEPGFLLDRFQRPEPRLTLGQTLRGIARAMADVSDGLVADAGHICRASGVGARIFADSVPVSEAARAAVASGAVEIGSLATGGDDYELVFAVPADRVADALAAASTAQAPVARIGEIVEGKGVALLDADGAAIRTGVGGYRHR